MGISPPQIGAICGAGTMCTQVPVLRFYSINSSYASIADRSLCARPPAARPPLGLASRLPVPAPRSRKPAPARPPPLPHVSRLSRLGAKTENTLNFLVFHVLYQKSTPRQDDGGKEPHRAVSHETSTSPIISTSVSNECLSTLPRSVDRAPPAPLLPPPPPREPLARLAEGGLAEVMSQFMRSFRSPLSPEQSERLFSWSSSYEHTFEAG